MKIPALALLFCLLAASANAEIPPGPDVTTTPERAYSTNAEALDSLAMLPPPPAYDSVAFLVDKARYEEGLTLRQGPRGEMAVLDAKSGSVHESLSEAFGVAITREGTPEIYALIGHLRNELGDMATRSAKQAYFRVRPYVLYDAPTCYKNDEERLRANGSYPSGHSARGWGAALILAEINPANKEAILKRGYETGQSRVICGYHWQSDVDAGRLAGAGAVAALHANPAFMEQLAKAKAELEALRKAGKVKTR